MAAETGNVTRLTRAEAWTADIPVGARVSWMPMRRLASDIVEESWTVEKGVARVTLAMRTLEYLEPGSLVTFEWELVGQSTFNIAAGSGSEIKPLPGPPATGDIVLIGRAADRDLFSANVLTADYVQAFDIGSASCRERVGQLG